MTEICKISINLLICKSLKYHIIFNFQGTILLTDTSAQFHSRAGSMILDM